MTNDVIEDVVAAEPAVEADVEAAPKRSRKKAEPAVEADADLVRVRITKQGDGQVFTGKADGSTFARNDTPSFPLDVAQALEARGFAEIDD